MNTDERVLASSNPRLIDSSVASHTTTQCQGMWIPPHQYPQNTPQSQLGVGNVTQIIIVPEGQCLNQERGPGLGTSIHLNQVGLQYNGVNSNLSGQSTVNVAGAPLPSTALSLVSNNSSPAQSILNQDSTGSSSLDQNSSQSFKQEQEWSLANDSLTALADAAELNQIRSLQSHLDSVLENSPTFEKHPSPNKNSVTIEEAPQIFHSCFYEKKPNLRPLPLAPFLSEDDVDVKFYNEIYHYLKSGHIREGASESDQKLIRKQALSYSINEDGTLSYGLKSSKTVIVKLLEQEHILKTAHDSHSPGFHTICRKMYNQIFSKYYWRTLYLDIGKFVKNCQECKKNESLVVQMSFHSPWKASEDQSTNVCDRIGGVWKKVHMRALGPLPKSRLNNEYLLILFDPNSGWILGQPVHNDNLEISSANFIFESFCTFGFAECQVFDLDSDQFKIASNTYREKVSTVIDVMEFFLTTPVDENWPFLKHAEETEEDGFPGKDIEEFCATRTADWDSLIHSFLFKFRVSEFNGSSSPFNTIFNRTCTGLSNEENKKSAYSAKEILLSQSRRNLKSSTLQCRHCCEIFTSKISFRIHQRKHTEEARRRGTMEGESTLHSETSSLTERRKHILRTRRKKASISKGTLRLLSMANSDRTEKSVSHVPSGMRRHLNQSTVEAVRSLLIATKDERFKRGKYFKYTQDLRDKIAQYALDHSIQSAVSFWSDKLGHALSESSVRNFIKNYKLFSTKIREEIGKFAWQYGIEKAVLYCQEKHNVQIRRGLVIKFKKIYCKKMQEASNTSENPYNLRKEANRSTSRQKRSFSLQIKDEIGNYATLYGIPAAVEHFSMKLQFPVKESTVRKFKKLYIDKNGDMKNKASDAVANESNSHNVNMLSEHHISQSAHPTMELVNETASVPPSNYHYHHPYSVNMTSGTGTIPMNASSINYSQGSSVNQGISPISYPHVPSATPTVIMNQNFAQVSSASFQPNYVGSFNSPNAGLNAGVITSQNGITVSLTHTPHSSVLPLNNANPMQLAMGGTHLNQVNPVSISQMHSLNSYSLHSHPTNHHQPLNASHHLVSSSFHQHLPNGITFESVHQINNHQEPLSLMKENSQNVESIHHINESDVVSATNHTSSEANHPCLVQARHFCLHQDIHQDQQSQSIHEEIQSLQQVPNLHTTSETHGDVGEQNRPSCSQQESLEDPEPPKPKRKTKRRKVSKGSSFFCSKRGNYGTYSPELRAEIGKYATENSSIATINYFKSKYNLDIPESTIRGLRDKFIVKKVIGSDNVKSLEFSQRGRPMRLGKFDGMVQECLRELHKGGEKITSFLVIATAKQLLMQHEPDLLQENGGPIKLNLSWAKSVLKRLGIKNS